MNGKERRKGSYLKFLFSYVIVFLLPVMVMLVYFYPAVSRNMNERAVIAGNHSLMLLKNSVDTQFRMISNYPSAILKDPDISARMLHDGSPYDHYLLQMELKKSWEPIRSRKKCFFSTGMTGCSSGRTLFFLPGK